MKIFCTKVYCILTNRTDARYTVHHTSVAENRFKLSVWLSRSNVPYARRYGWQYVIHAFAVKLPAQYRKLLYENFDKYVIMCSPGVLKQATSYTKYNMR
jgi:hypothetical protein